MGGEARDAPLSWRPMNYQHRFHAGNHADVLKHAVLLELLTALSAKPNPWFVLDTHAGAGSYDRSEEHTSELQSLMRISYAVFCLKKKNIKTQNTLTHQNHKPIKIIHIIIRRQININHIKT